MNITHVGEYAAEKARETVLRAPIAGTLQELAVHTVGGVVTPAQALMKIVPDQASVLIEATVDNKDVGFVHAGQGVEVKVATFTFTRYGFLHGHVVDISRDATEPNPRVAQPPAGDGIEDDTADGVPQQPPGGYRAHISLAGDSFIVDGTARKQEPGMQIMAEINTGERRVIGYQLAPLARYAHWGCDE